MKILVTGGTVLVSKFVANYFSKENEVYVLNRNTKNQLNGVNVIRHNLGDSLKKYHFGAVLDICAIFNVGNEQMVDINEFVSLCYKIAGKELRKVNVYNHENQRDYFSFYDYEYCLDVSNQKTMIADTKNLELGL